MVGTLLEYESGKFPDLFVLCPDIEATIKRWPKHQIVRLHYQYPKPHTMLAVIIEEEEIKIWQEKESGAR